MRKRGLLILHSQALLDIYGEEHLAAISKLVEIYAPPQTAAFVARAPEMLAEAELIFSGWGAPVMNEGFLRHAPRLQAVFYGAGSVHGFATDALWKRQIVVTSAAAMNAVPVADFTVAQILFSLKHGWRHLLAVRQAGSRLRPDGAAPGIYQSRVGIVSLGLIGRRVCELLRSFDLQVLAYDPYVAGSEFRRLGAARADLDELFRTCDVISLHTPRLPSTLELISGHHFEMMKPGATFINTARGEVVDEADLIRVFARRPEIWAVLDVLAENDAGVDPKIFQLPNVVITPHIAGSLGRERRRMGAAMVEELKRYLLGQPLLYQVDPDRLPLSA